MNPDLASAVDRFVDRVRERMEAGARTYGDVSLSAPPAALLTEIQEELEDVCGWSVLLWHRLEQLRDSVAAIDDEVRS